MECTLAKGSRMPGTNLGALFSDRTHAKPVTPDADGVTLVVANDGEQIPTGMHEPDRADPRAQNDEPRRVLPRAEPPMCSGPH